MIGKWFRVNAVLGITIDFSTNLSRQWEVFVLGGWGESQYLQTAHSLGITHSLGSTYKYIRVSKSRHEPHHDALTWNHTLTFEGASNLKYAISARQKPVPSNGPLSRNHTLSLGSTYKYIRVSRRRCESHHDALTRNHTLTFEDASKFKHAISAG